MMAANPRVSTDLLIPKKWNNVREITSPDRTRVWIEPKSKTNVREITSPDRTRVWIEPKSKTTTTPPPPKKVAVLYYLSRNGHLEHPHLIEVTLPSSQGLYLRDVMNSLNLHRGKGMANMYSWSSKRSYKNGYVWHDVSEDDLIHPTNSHDYILKGTKLLQTSPDLRSYETNSTQTPPETNTSSGDDCNSSTVIRRRNQSWSSFDNPQEYIVYKCESSREFAAKFAADAGTQTTEEKRRRSVRVERKKENVGQSLELNREEMVSPPQLNSSEDGSDGVSGLRDVDRSGEIRDRTADGRNPSGRMKASKVLMQLISCGRVSVKGVAMRSEQEWTFDERK